MSESEEQQLESAVVMRKTMTGSRKKGGRKHSRGTQKTGVLSEMPTKNDCSLMYDQTFVNYNLFSFDFSELFCFQMGRF